MRLKLIAGNLIVVLIVGLASYFVVKGQVEAASLERLNTQIVHDQQLLERSLRLSAATLVDQVRERAAERSTSDVFVALDESGRRLRAYEQANRIAEWFGHPARGHGGQPDLVVIVDRSGHVVARNADRNRMNGDDLNESLPALRRTLSTGSAQHDLWQTNDDQRKVLRTGIAPIRDPQDGGIIGAVLVGYDLSNGFAEAEAARLGGEVAFVVEERVYSQSVSRDMAEQLQSHLFGVLETTTREALAAESSGGEDSAPVWSAHLGSSDYRGAVAAFPASPSLRAAYVVLGDRDAALSISSSTNIILVLMAIGLLLIVAYGIFMASSFLTPIAQMEEGILKITNGQTELRLDIESEELGGLAFRINELLNVFTGTPEADESGRISSPPEPGAWAGAASPVSGEQRLPADDDDEEEDEGAEALAAEPEEEYYARVYKEYVAAKEAAGEDVSQISEDKFVQRLKANEGKLQKKHDCRMVRFKVQKRGNQVNLLPVIIR